MSRQPSGTQKSDRFAALYSPFAAACCRPQPQRRCGACVQKNLLMRLQDAIIGPSVILSFKKPIRVFDRVRRGAATSSGTEPHWRLDSDIPPELPVRASYASSPRGPGAATRRERRAPRLLRAAQAPEGKSLSIAHRHAVDARALDSRAQSHRNSDIGASGLCRWVKAPPATAQRGEASIHSRQLTNKAPLPFSSE